VQPQRRRLWGGLGVAFGLLIGFARIVDGAHWLSDVLWACPVTLTCSWLVWQLLLMVYRGRRR
jgi:lipid A 4'-phosphatase